MRPLLLVVLLVTAVGCGRSPAAGAPPDRPPDIVGTLTSVAPFVPVTEDCVDAAALDPDGSVSSDDPPVCSDPDTTARGSVLVEEQPDVVEGDKLSLHVDASTALYRRTADGGLEPITFGDLAHGTRAEAWHTGIIAESYPGQGTAVAIVVDGGG